MRRENMNRTIPIAMTMPPLTAHLLWPLMKLPGITPKPCRSQTQPMRISTTAKTVAAIFMLASKSNDVQVYHKPLAESSAG